MIAATKQKKWWEFWKGN
ncbi:DUF3967 domain-containing protein (plasmid) [Bacillus subtilis]